MYSSFRCLLSVIPIVFAQAQGVGNLSGTVRSDDGSPLVNARVVAQLRVPGMPALVRAADTGPGGTFTLSGVQAGVYEVCAMPKGPGFFNGCASANAAERLTAVRAGESVTAPAITVRRAASLQVTVNDPSNELSKANSLLLLNVVVPGYPPVPLSQLPARGTQRVFEAPVPRGVAVKLFARSAGFAMVDSRAAAVSPEHSQEVAGADGPVRSVAFEIRGRL